ncbi:hypothetical protein V8G54_034866 [Vigna mungo]|uniref:Uncharacterized protein n=1 Tax=Vigna mungo TaxID=3915 RepID=A0AAQ3RDY3_VIGMU
MAVDGLYRNAQRHPRLMRMMGARTKQTEENSDGSQGSVNGNGKDRHNDPNWRRRMELPTFEGPEPLNWINRAENMEGSVSYWFKFWKEKMSDRSWEGLKEALVIRFEGRNRGGILERMVALKQMGMVDERVTIKIFSGGIARESTLTELMVAMPIVRDGEELYGGVKTAGGGGMERNLTNWSRLSGAVSRASKVGKPNFDNGGRNSRNLPYSEFAKSGGEGSCFRYFRLGIDHMGRERSLRILIMAEDEKEDGAEEETELAQPKTMKLQGEIEGKRVLILMDSGTSHTFVGKGLVEELCLPMEDTPPYQRKKTNRVEWLKAGGTNRTIEEELMKTRRWSYKFSLLFQPPPKPRDLKLQLVAAAHGITIENLIMNLSLKMLVGGKQSVKLGDEEASRRGVQKTVWERKGPYMFSCGVDNISKTKFCIHCSLEATIDDIRSGCFPNKLRRKMMLKSSKMNHFSSLHVSQLKPAIGAKKVEKELPADLQMEGPSCWPTKEDRITMQEQFPEFNLGDKVDLQGGSNVRSCEYMKGERE